ncbi:WbqC family protein [Hymenobacter siberiensis]|uniref:WbqC family protein n=1 Tax=Hymenobacter siberiensis TaxID=2848396 RepID=UPI001F38A4C2|nr:WbqC family protein [Hymenobacter siberiensis]
MDFSPLRDASATLGMTFFYIIQALLPPPERPMIFLTELHYHPPAALFAALMHADGILLEAHEHYRKQTYRNRCLIRTAQGVKPLTVPVLDGNRAEKVSVSAIEIDYRQNWIHQHWRTLQTAYGNSPYFEYYADYLHDIYVSKPALLFDLNQRFLRLLLKCFRITLPLHLTTEYHAYYPAQLSSENAALATPSLIADRRDWLTPKAAIKTPEPDTPAVSGLVQPYPQVFGPGFEPNLSVLDLLFSQGPAAGSFFNVR